MSVQANVEARYSEGAKQVQAELCCPVDYDRNLLKILPAEIIEKDYGCGDPSRYVREGDTVLDLGSGGGKICYMAAQLVGDKGQVIGVDMTPEMLALARKYQGEMADKLGGDRVEFHRGYIQDLAIDLDKLDEYLKSSPVHNSGDATKLEAWKNSQRKQNPMIADNSIDLVISNCVLNLVDEAHKAQLIEEIFRVTKPGGRVAISDIVSDELIPEHLKADPALWSGCISGAFHETGFLQAFLDAGFVAVGYDKWDHQPWKVVEGIEFRSVTLVATKPTGSECIDRGHAVLYKGPYKEISDDEGHVFPRGERMAVCERTYEFIKNGPYREDFIVIQPADLRDPVDYCAPVGTKRPASETKGGSYQTTSPDAGSCC